MAKPNHKNVVDTEEMRDQIETHVLDLSSDGITLSADDVDYYIVYVPAEQQWLLWINEDGENRFEGFDSLRDQLDMVADNAVEEFYFDEVAEELDEEDEEEAA